MENSYTQYYFIGIGGAGMSALARYYNAKGFSIAGYDLRSSKITDDLISEGVEVTFDESTASIPSKFLKTHNTLVVITPAVPNNHLQLEYFRQNDFKIIKRSELLGSITKSNKAVCIAGTHGKTTTSSMTAHLFHQSQIECSAFLGGISNNYNTNMLLSNNSNYVIVEADEFDRSFHYLHPFMAVITSVDPDHLDIYGTEEAFIQSFEHFASLISTGGVLLTNEKVSIAPKLKKGVKHFTYGFGSTCDFRAENIEIKKGVIHYDFVTPTETAHDIRLSVPLMINVENSIAAMAMAWINGVTIKELRSAMSSFSGIYRRFDFKFQTDNFVYIDDYAHHPNELEASISSIRKLYPDRKITGIFQPHLYSRTNSFQNEFAKELSNLDSLILLDIYPAREEPIPGVTSEVILKNVAIEEKTLLSKDKLLAKLDKIDLDVLVTFGAGDIDKLVPEITKYVKKRFRKASEEPSDESSTS